MVPEARGEDQTPISRIKTPPRPLLNFGGMELFPFGRHASAAAQLPAPKVPFSQIAKEIKCPA